ncbi:MAG: HAMP domain-containing protein [Chloroflexaceae bacterium]|nr:HAMP domain-containing protein [Chloroflexaceae bacterium]
MKRLDQIRWKLFFCHLGIILIVVVVFLSIAHLMALAGLGEKESAYQSTGPSPIVSDITSGQAVLSLKDSLLQKYQMAVHEALLAGAFAALSAAVLVNLFVTQIIVEPLQAISRVSKRLARGFYRERLSVTSNDELGELCQSVNQLAEALEQTEKRRLALLTDVTHELRTPLSTIEGYMEGLLDGVIQPGSQTFALLLKEATRLQRLIEDLELLSRAEAGQIPIVPRVVNLRLLLENLVTRFFPQFQAKQVTLELIASETFLPVWVDPDRVDQVAINLLNNALRYTPSGGRVWVQVWDHEGYAVVSVKDTGIGITSEHLPHIFERFYRVDKSRSRTSGGSGIGLTIASHLVYAQGGEITAWSRGSGTGSDFRFTLPMVSGVGVRAVERSTQPVKAHRSGVQPFKRPARASDALP